MQYPFIYKVTYYDEVDNANRIGTGMGFADNWADATEKLVDAYGEKDIVSINNLELCEESTLIPLPEEVCDVYAKSWYPYTDFSTLVPKDKEQETEI